MILLNRLMWKNVKYPLIMKSQHTTILKRVILIAIIQFMIKEIVHPPIQ